MYKVLAIAGSDCSGGAGIQADIKTITALGAYAMSAVTALTAQNTTGVYGISDAEPDFVGLQLDCVFTDIFPDAVKIGMVSNVRIIGVIADKLAQYAAANVVLDPVMAAASGGRLIADDAIGAVIERLFPLARVVTPNIPEAEIICGFKITDAARMAEAAAKIAEAPGFNGAVLLKGGHLFGADDSDDLLYINGAPVWIRGGRIANPNTHGTGCTLSSAIACGLASGLGVEQSAREAKEYLSGALGAMLDLGSGRGPLDHFYAARSPKVHRSFIKN